MGGLGVEEEMEPDSKEQESSHVEDPMEKVYSSHSDLPKHQATALFLLRTEVIEPNAGLTSIR